MENHMWGLSFQSKIQKYIYDQFQIFTINKKTNHMPDSLQILVSSSFVFGNFGRVIFFMMVFSYIAHWSATVMTPSEKFREPILHYTIYYCILDQKTCRPIKNCENWSKLVMTFIWTFRNLIFLLYDYSHYGLYSIFYASLIILDISYNNFSEGVPATVVIDCFQIMGFLSRLFCSSYFHLSFSLIGSIDFLVRTTKRPN